jgi:hypothetical protein
MTNQQFELNNIQLSLSDKTVSNVNYLQELLGENKATIVSMSIGFTKQILELLNKNKGSKLYIEHENGDIQEITFNYGIN